MSSACLVKRDHRSRNTFMKYLTQNEVVNITCPSLQRSKQSYKHSIYADHERKGNIFCRSRYEHRDEKIRGEEDIWNGHVRVESFLFHRQPPIKETIIKNIITQSQANKKFIVGMHFWVSFLCLGIRQRKEDRGRGRIRCNAVRRIREER